MNIRLIAIVFSCIAFATIIAAQDVIPLSDTSNKYYNENNNILNSIFENEKNPEHLKNITDVTVQIDEAYGDLYNKLKKGEKITIFLDPAHGRLDNGKWQGESTGRISSSGLTEEFYSIQFARKFYKLLSNNRFFRVISHKDYMAVLRGETDEYKKTLFSETVKLARSEKAFIIISEHLNNISVLQKTDGIINMPGIHVTCDEAGNRYLTYIYGAYEGYLTLYNKYDSSGFSRSIAYRMKESLSAKGIKLNAWDYGAVADDRFSFFIDFPVSVIFEQGFISNPVEEVKLRDPDYQQKIVDSQYAAILESIERIFGIDVSGFWLKRINDNPDITDLIKLSRIAIYYLQNNFPEKAVNIITEMEKNYKDLDYSVAPFINLKERMLKAENLFKTSKYFEKMGRSKEAKYNLMLAARIVYNEKIFSSLADKYSQYARRHFGIYNIASIKKEESFSKINVPIISGKASIYMPVIFVIENGQTIEDAIDKALSPNPETAVLLAKNFDNIYKNEKVKSEKYSKKLKKTITVWKVEKKKVDLKEGIYIVAFYKNLKIKNLQRISQVLLDPYRYQNHQYLNNSYFGGNTKERSL